jgi:hypothetical protein
MDANLMKKYVEYLNDIGLNKAPMLMVYDSFKGHLEESVKKKFHDNGFDLAVIPGGLTSICQPLDVAINKPFKDNLRKEWHFWMANGGAGLTTGGNLKRARLSDVCNWVKNSWENISSEMIIQSFKTCAISNPLNDNKENDEDFDKENDEDFDKKNEDFNEENENFEITDDNSDYEESVDMKVSQARYIYNFKLKSFLFILLVLITLLFI